MYEWYWGHTAAQIDMIDIDAPKVVYRTPKSDAKPGEKGFKKTAEEASRDYERWLARQKADKEKGVKLDLGTFLSTGEKVPSDEAQKRN